MMGYHKEYLKTKVGDAIYSNFYSGAQQVLCKAIEPIDDQFLNTIEHYYNSVIKHRLEYLIKRDSYYSVETQHYQLRFTLNFQSERVDKTSFVITLIPFFHYEIYTGLEKPKELYEIKDNSTTPEILERFASVTDGIGNKLEWVKHHLNEIEKIVDSNIQRILEFKTYGFEFTKKLKDEEGFE